MPKVTNRKEIVRETLLKDGTVQESREDVFVYVHCYNQACPQYHNLQANLNFEERVPGILQETEYTYTDRGGDAAGVENSHVRFHVQDEADANCPTCGEARNVSDMPSYKIAQYGVGPGMGLKGIERAEALAAARAKEQSAGTDAKMAELQTQVEQLTKMVAQGQQKRQPGRPKGSKNKPKDPVAAAIAPPDRDPDIPDYEEGEE